MDLKTFVEEALCQIAEAMESAQTRLKDKGVRINPLYRVTPDHEYEAIALKNYPALLQKIEFDVAVTATETGRKDGGMSISVFTAKIQGEGSSESVNSSVSRIRFQIVAQLPHAKSEDK